MNRAPLLTRLHYRQWLGERFINAWLEPVANWCQQHDLPLVGHISPEDDPIEQAACVTNLMPVFKQFTLAGIDLIIPAVGDEQHPLINLGVVCATSAAQQNDQPGVLSESLGASGLDADVELATCVLGWQSLMGVTSLVVHGAFQSTAGMRHFDAPPDWGPNSARWAGMKPLGEMLAEVQAVTRDARQIAPVAVLWPIRSFLAQSNPTYSHDAPLRDALVDLIHQCLARQVGVHVIDEAALEELVTRDGRACLGKAQYSHLIVPPCDVLHERSVTALRRLRSERINVLRVGHGPQWVQSERELSPADMDDFELMTAEAAVERLPRLVTMKPAHPHVRCTMWERDGCCTALLMTLGNEPCEVRVENRTLALTPNRVQMIKVDAPQTIAT